MSVKQIGGDTLFDEETLEALRAQKVVYHDISDLLCDGSVFERGEPVELDFDKLRAMGWDVGHQ